MRSGELNRGTRRDYLRWSAACGLAVWAGPLAAGQTARDDDYWVDAHSHIWTRDIQRYPLAGGQGVEVLKPPSFTADELLAVAQPLGVRRVVLIQHHIYHGFDNSYLIDETARRPDTFRVVGMIDETLPHPDQKMRELLKKHVTALRITSWIRPDNWLDTPGMHTVWRTAAETRQALGCLIDPPNLVEVDRMCQRYPQTVVVIDHFARIGVDGQIRDSDLNRLCRLARFPLVYVKVSAFYALGKKRPPYEDLVPMIRRVYEAFGPKRLMWASDAPYQLQPPNSYAASMELIKSIDFWTEEERQWITRKTAEKVYFFDA
ncbi:MAG: hypothetical protein KatS3mg110_2468 [Pirellulaceae bacterium]|nr:MAG: hypothetical protein KatS3mg110_2468 [Pirellulaceae bacterium]